MLPARRTELARTADVHIVYRRKLEKEAGALTPQKRAELWAEAEKLVPPLKEKEIMTDIEDIRADHEYHQEHPTPPPTVDVDALVEAHEPTPAPEAPAFDDASQTEAEKIASALAHDNMDKAAEIGKLKAELAQRNDTIRRLLDSRKELEKQLADLHHDQRMMPLARTAGAVEIMTLFQDILLVEQRNAADKELAALLADNWQLVPQLCASDLIRRTVFLQRQLRAVEPKPDADKPTNVRDFPVPDAELTAEGDGVSALASIPAAHGLGNGGVVRRVI